MTQDELDKRWVGAIVKLDIEPTVAQVQAVTPYGGRLSIDCVLADGRPLTTWASAVTILDLHAIQVAYSQLQRSQEQVKAYQEAVSQIRTLTVAASRA